MKNPLIKRLPRELIGEFPKYIVIFLFMTLTIGFISGFLVAGNSMIIAYDESFEKYNIEDGHVEFEEEADDTMMDEVEKEEKVTFYKDFYKEAASILKKDNSQGTMRVFQPRETVNKICLMEGTMPKKKNQVAIDRMHADNNNWKIGDKITLDGKEYDICGLVALSDYSALYSDNNDFMFDAVKFGVAVMSKEGYETLSEDKEHFQYDWVYADKSQTEKEKNDKAEDFMTAVFRVYLCKTVHFAVGQPAFQLLAHFVEVRYFFIAQCQSFLLVVGLDILDINNRVRLFADREDVLVQTVVDTLQHRVMFCFA